MFGNFPVQRSIPNRSLQILWLDIDFMVLTFTFADMVGRTMIGLSERACHWLERLSTWNVSPLPRQQHYWHIKKVS